MVAAAFSNALCIQGIFHAVYSDMQDDTSRQPVAFAAIMGYCAASMTIFTTIGAPQPEQRRCPGENNSSFFDSSFKLSDVGILLPHSDVFFD
jgi:hypothetical protein